MKHDDWYKRATGNKAQLGYTFTVRMGSAWLRWRDSYINAVLAQEKKLAEGLNYKAARMLRYHRRALPKTLPYEIVVTGAEWPLLASALIAGVDADPQVQSLYVKFQRAKKEVEPDVCATPPSAVVAPQRGEA